MCVVILCYLLFNQSINVRNDEAVQIKFIITETSKIFRRGCEQATRDNSLLVLQVGWLCLQDTYALVMMVQQPIIKVCSCPGSGSTIVEHCLRGCRPAKFHTTTNYYKYKF